MAKTKNQTKKQTKKRRKSSKIICYNGRGSLDSGVHTETEFLKIINTKKNRYYVEVEGLKMPKTAKEWVKWAGASYVSKSDAKKCERNTRKYKRFIKKFKIMKARKGRYKTLPDGEIVFSKAIEQMNNEILAKEYDKLDNSLK